MGNTDSKFSDQGEGESLPTKVNRLPFLHSGGGADLGNARSTWTDQLATKVNLNHFRLLRVVGKGAFGKVRIVERKDSGLTFALKYIRKDEGQLDSAY
jgi:serine/threonine protein kinase